MSSKYRNVEEKIKEAKDDAANLIRLTTDNARAHVVVAHEKLGEAAARMELAGVLAGEEEE